MGDHKGFRVVPRNGNWMGQAWDGGSKKYRSRTFARRDEARTWAREQSAKFATRLDYMGDLQTKRLATDFLADLVRRKRVPSHIDDVRRVLTSYAIGVPDLLSPRALAQTEDWLSNQDEVKASTRNKYLAYVKALANWATRRQLLPRNPLLAIGGEKVPLFLKEQFTYDELVRLTCADGDPFHLRWCAMIYLGLRVTEPMTMDYGKIDWQGRMAAVTGKGSKERLVPMPDEFMDLLPRKESGPVFEHVPANRYREFMGFLSRQDVPRMGRSPHSTRHTYAGLMTATGMPSILLQAYMGHAATATTASYAKLASRYVSVVEGWARGQLLLRSSPVRSLMVRARTA